MSRTRTTPLAGADDDVRELLDVAGGPASAPKREGAGRGRRRLVDRAGGDLQVGRAQRGHDLARGQVARRHPRRVEPDAHRIVARAEDCDVADAVDARQHVLT